MSSEDSVKRQWNEAVGFWVDSVRGGSDVYREYMNAPSFKGMVGDVAGKRLLDVACGEGELSRYFARAGAIVTAIDLSEEMIGAALDEERRAPLGIEYHVADATDLGDLKTGIFDVVCCFLALMDIEDYEAAIGEAARVLRESGRFVAIFLHPCFSWHRTKDGEIMCDWERVIHDDGSSNSLYLKIYDYFQRHQYEKQWRDERHPEGFTATLFHRTLSDYFNTLGKNGLYISGMEEPQPVEGVVEAHPGLAKLFRVPVSIVVEAVKVR